MAEKSEPVSPMGAVELDIQAILKARGGQYGDFLQMAWVAQTLKRTIRAVPPPTGPGIDNAYMEALDMICTKMARIACGNQDNLDSWADIVGYAQLGFDHAKEVGTK